MWSVFLLIWTTVLSIAVRTSAEKCYIMKDHEKFYLNAGITCGGELPSLGDAEKQCGKLGTAVACIANHTRGQCGNAMGDYTEIGLSWWMKTELIKKVGTLPNTTKCAQLEAKAAEVEPAASSSITDCNIFQDKFVEELEKSCGKFDFDSTPTDAICSLSQLQQSRNCAGPIIEQSCGTATLNVMEEIFSLEVVEMKAKFMDQYSELATCRALYNAEAPKVAESKLASNSPKITGKCTVVDDHKQFYLQLVLSCPSAIVSSTVDAAVQCRNFQTVIQCQKAYTKDKCGDATANYLDAGLSWWGKEQIKAEKGQLPTSGPCAELTAKAAVLEPPAGSVITDKFFESLKVKCGEFQFDQAPTDARCGELRANADCALPVITDSCGKVTADFMEERFSVEVVKLKIGNPTEFSKNDKCNKLYDEARPKAAKTKLATNAGDEMQGDGPNSFWNDDSSSSKLSIGVPVVLILVTVQYFMMH